MQFKQTHFSISFAYQIAGVQQVRVDTFIHILNSVFAWFGLKKSSWNCKFHSFLNRRVIFEIGRGGTLYICIRIIWWRPGNSGTGPAQSQLASRPSAAPSGSETETGSWRWCRRRPCLESSAWPPCSSRCNAEPHPGRTWGWRTGEFFLEGCKVNFCRDQEKNKQLIRLQKKNQNKALDTAMKRFFCGYIQTNKFEKRFCCFLVFIGDVFYWLYIVMKNNKIKGNQVQS